MPETGDDGEERGDGEARNSGDRTEPRSSRDGFSGFSFSLPPIRLPPLFPDSIEIHLPVPGFRYAARLSSGWVLLVALGFDVADALLAAATAGPVALLRTLGGALIAVTLARGFGLLYLWEVASVLLGYGSATVVPTLGVIVVLWLWLRSVRGRERLPGSG